MDADLKEQFELRDFKYQEMMKDYKLSVTLKVNILKTKVIELENANKYMGLEVNRLNEEIERQKNDQDEKDASYREQMDDLIDKFEDLQNKRFAQGDQEKLFNAERIAHEQQRQQLMEKIKELEQNLNLLRKDNFELQQLSEQRMIEIKRWKDGLVEENGDHSQLTAQMNEQKKTILECREKIVQLQGEKNSLSGKLSSSEQEKEHGKQELQNCYDLIKSVK